MKKTSKNLLDKSLSCLLAVLLVITMMPLAIRAEDEASAEEPVIYKEGQDMQMWCLPDGTESGVDHSITDQKLTYYCIDEYGKDASSLDQLYERILLNSPKNDSSKDSAIKQWAKVAQVLIQNNWDAVSPSVGDKSTFPFGCNLDDYLSRTDFQSWDQNGSKDDNYPDGYDFHMDCSGLVRTNSLYNVWNDMISNCQNRIDRKPSYSQRDDWEDRFKIPSFIDDKTERTVYYTMLNSAARTHSTNKYHVDNAILAFYDFEVKDVVPDHYETAIDDELAMEEDGTEEVGYLNDLAKSNGGVYENYTIEDDSGTQSLTDGHFENASRVVGGSQSCSYTYTDSESVTTARASSTSQTSGGSVGMGVSYSRAWGAWGRLFNFNAEQGKVARNSLTATIGGSYNWSECLSNSEAVVGRNSTSNTRTINCAIPPLPAHTGTDCELNLTNTTQRVDFNGPLCVTFKVAIATCSGNCYADTLTIFDTDSYHQNSMVFKFGEGRSSELTTDAVSHLYNLYNTHEGRIESDGGASVWESTLTNLCQWNREASSSNAGNTNTNLSITWPSADDTSAINVIESASTRVPVVQTPLKMTVKAYHASISQGSIYPLYMLKRIVSDSNETLVMDTNDKCNINDVIHLTGYDAGEKGASNTDVAEYYGFNQKLGTWVMCDEGGNELPDQNSPILSITDNNGYVTLTSKDVNGDTYIKYKINEDCYHSYYEGDGEYTKNSELTEVPIIKVTVTAGAGFTGTLKVEGDLQLTVGKPIDLYSDENTLRVYGIDSKGQQTLINNNEIQWYPIETSLQQDQNSPSIFTPIEAGEAHIGIEYGGVQYIRGREGRTTLYGYPVTVHSPEEPYSAAPMAAMTAYNGNVVFGDNSDMSNETEINYCAKTYSDDDHNQIVNWMAINALYDIGKVMDAANGTETTSESKQDVYVGLKYLKEAGIIDSEFDPNADLTRENLARMCYTLAKTKGIDTSANDCILDCTDVSSVSGDAYNAVNWTVSKGILKLEDNYINPKGGFTQQQFKDSIRQFVQSNSSLYVSGKTSYLKEVIVTFLYALM